MATFRRVGRGVEAAVCVKGVRRSKVLQNKRAARSWAAEMEYELSRNGSCSPTMRLQDLFQRYAEEVSEKKKGAHWEIIRLRGFLQYPMAKVKLADIRREDLEDWIEQRLQSVKPSSVNRELNLLSHCFTQARRWRLMSHNPMEDLQRPKNPPHRDRRVSPEEQQAILLCLNYSEEWPVLQQQQRVALAFLFALETAMRAGEICALRPEHIDTDGRVAYLVDTKNGFPRKVPLSLEALRLLDRLKPWDEGETLFRVRSGNLSTVFKKGVARAGIEDLTFHDTRHEAITRLAKKLDVMDLARMVGHRDIKQLMTYYNKQAEELAQQLD